jgi:23S rRNA (cytidine1920-2'-O)/16S rRNA (cytidine1409-2'-O)-methyltransferase
MVTVRGRLDAELVRRGLARSREQAAELIAAGRVAVAGQTASKSATQVAKDTPVTVAADGGDDAKYVSRGGHKLAGALSAFVGLEVAGKRCLDAGASTGGFTDVLLRAGAAEVVAADVGYGQLAWSLRTDDRVTVLDRVNVRTLDPALVAPPPQVVVADLSFISLSKVLPALAACAAPDADFALMVKPQFEMGKGRVGAGGVVRSPDDRAAAVRAVCGTAWTLGLGVKGVTASPLPGPAGNVEYFVWFRRGAPPLDDEALRQAIDSGPRLPRGHPARLPRTAFPGTHECAIGVALATPMAHSYGAPKRWRRTRAPGGTVSCTRWVIQGGRCWCSRTPAGRAPGAARGRSSSG